MINVPFAWTRNLHLKTNLSKCSQPKLNTNETLRRNIIFISPSGHRTELVLRENLSFDDVQ